MDESFERENPEPLVYVPSRVIITDPSAVRARHPSFPPEIQRQLLAMQFRDVSFADARASGNAFFDSRTQSWSIRTERPLASFKGLVFEAMVARMCYEQPGNVGRRALAWCTNRSPNRVSEEMAKGYIPFVTADNRLLGSRLTATFYNTGSPFDIQFYRINALGTAELATQVGANVIAGIQAKAILGNEREEIIDPVLSGRYPHVLTMLTHKRGEHSYEVCQRLLISMARNGQITGEEAIEAANRITCPAALGIDQGYIEDYSAYIDDFYRNRAEEDTHLTEAIALEVSQGLTVSPGGILIPAERDLILPPTLR